MKQAAIIKRLIRDQRKLFVGNQQGQAVVEYTLMLIVILSLLLAFRGVFTSMNTFMSSFVGDYVVCLMEYGELPALGIQNSDLKQHTQGTGRKCSAPSFSALYGSAATTSSGGGSTSNGGTSNSTSGSNQSQPSRGNKTGPSTNADNHSSADGARSGSDSGFSGSSRSGAGRGDSPYSRGQITRFGSSSIADAPGVGAKKVKIIEDAGLARSAQDRFESDASNRSNRSSSGYRSSKYKAIAGDNQLIENMSKSIVRKPASKVLSTSDEGYRFVPTKRTFNPPSNDVAPNEKKDEGLGFGNFIKWIIIAGIIIACFILFGGQIMNYSNSDS